MRISRDKINVLARRVTTALEGLQDQKKIEFVEDPNSTRQEVRRILEELLTHEARIDTAARLKIGEKLNHLATLDRLSPRQRRKR